MNRISRHQAFMGCAQIWAQRSTCMRRNVGAVVVINGRIISHGYNGAPPGEPHCLGAQCVPPGQVGCTRTIHAEANALRHVPTSLYLDYKTLYTTESPCMACAALAEEYGVKSVYFANEYRVADPIDFLLRRGIKVFNLTPSGYVVDRSNNKLMED